MDFQDEFHDINLLYIKNLMNIYHDDHLSSGDY
jgi:hypothetical protein